MKRYVLNKESVKEILYSNTLNTIKINNSKLEAFPEQDSIKMVDSIIECINEEIDKMDDDTFDINLIIKWFDNLLKPYFIEKDTYMIFNNPLNEMIISKVINNDIDIQPFIDYIFNLQEEAKNSEQHKKCLNKYLNFKNKENLTQEEFEKFVFSLINLNSSNEEDYYFVIKMILDENYTLPDNEYIDFFQKFCLFNLKVFNLDNIDLNICIFKGTEHGSHGFKCVENKKIEYIKINKKYLKPNNLYENLEALFHEMKHAIQEYETGLKYRLDIIKRIEDKVLMGYIYNDNSQKNIYYEENYKYLDAEVDANIESNYFILELLKKYAPKTYEQKKDEIQEKLKKYYVLKDEDNRVTSYSDLNNIYVLFASKLKEHKEIICSDLLSIEEKTVLFQIFDPNFNPKTIDTYFKEKEKLYIERDKTPLSDEEKLYEIKNKIEFYDAVISSIKYSNENLLRNIHSLKKYHSQNDDINIEVQYTIAKLEQELKLNEILNSGDENDRNKEQKSIF